MWHRAALVAALLLPLGCAGPTTPEDQIRPGVDTVHPFPIDAADEPGAPSSYKQLPLGLLVRGEPVVTPVDGVIGVVCVGMSNGAQECDAYLQRLATTYQGEVNPLVRVVNCAVGGHAIERWSDPAFDAQLWTDCLERKIPGAGLRPGQVRVLWHKAANQFTTLPGGGALPTYPAAGSDYEAFHQNLTHFAARVLPHFPSLQAVYTSSRSYGGFAGHPGRGEPLSYEEGHALNAWLEANPSVDGVWYGWGPYLWAPACSLGIRNGGGVCYDRTDYQADGIHPTASGRAKVSDLLHARLREHAWYRR